MNKRGQALIEAMAAIGISTAFFVASAGLAVRLMSDLKSEQQELDRELCRMSPPAYKNGSIVCKAGSTIYMPSPNGGFMLISTLIQMLLLLFCFQLIYLLIVYRDIQFFSLSECFDSSLEKIQELAPKYPASNLTETLKVKTDLQNKFISSIAQVQSTASDPQLEYAPSDRSLSRVVYDLHLRIQPKNKFHFLNLGSQELNYRCGVEKLCSKKNCQFSIIADKSYLKPSSLAF